MTAVATLYTRLTTRIEQTLTTPAPATGLGVFRILFGLVALQEILFLLYFRHLIYDPVPYLDTAGWWMGPSLLLWALAALCLTVGWQTRIAAVINYLYWMGFVVYTPMWDDFDGGFDQMMTGSSFLLIFLPSERALSLDRLRLSLRHSRPGMRFELPRTVPMLAYCLPVAFSLSLLYLDSAIHKLSAEHWRHGLGAWLPAIMPYYISPLDMSPLLNLKPVEMLIGYGIIGFQFLFPWFCFHRRWRVPLLLGGLALHGGIVLSLNIYPFGFGMLAHYTLLAPFRWWRKVGAAIRCSEPRVTVFYDGLCPLCNRTALVVEHFDLRGAVALRDLQTHARNYPALSGIAEQELLRDIYALDGHGRLHRGVDCYAAILGAMGYTAPLGWLLRAAPIHPLASRVYRHIADNRARLACDEGCALPAPPPALDPVQRLIEAKAPDTAAQARWVARFAVLALALQFNCTLQYGVLHRLGVDLKAHTPTRVLKLASDLVISLSHTVLGITPHALYLHDHFDGYHHLFAFTWRDPITGAEHWLPFVGPDGRMLAPNWGRVHSMWANVAVTGHPRPERFERLTRKVTAFYGTRLGLDLNDTAFGMKMKNVEVPTHWVHDLRRKNLEAPWTDVGQVVWHGGQMRIETPGLRLSDLR